MLPQRALETEVGGHDIHMETFVPDDSSEGEEEVEIERVETRKSNLQRHQTTPIDFIASELSVNNIPRPFTI